MPSARAGDEGWAGSIYDAFDKNDDLNFEFSTGIEYDSNVSVIDIDTQTAEDDFAAVFDAGVSYRADLAKGSTLSIGYQFGQDLQFEFSEFDTQTHRAFASFEQQIGDVETGFSYHIVYARLGSNGFLRMHRASPHLAGYALNKRVYWRAAYTYSDKEFIDRPNRSSIVHAGAGDAYVFLNGADTYVMGGYRYENENAVGPEFDFRSHNTRLKLVQRLRLGQRKMKLKSGWQYEDRNYENITPAIGAIRDDERHKFDVSLEIPLNDIVYTEIEYSYDRFNSNLPSAEFDQNITAIRIGGKL
ncbi:MAG: DUF560 domain-containing protein [Marinicaulis sp.]|nr:DUF560 domain-containing protein [Marinicaulis sp.]